MKLDRFDPRFVLICISEFGKEGPYRDRPGFEPHRRGSERPADSHR